MVSRLQQTTRAIEALKGIGLARKDFSVRVRYSKRLGGYDGVQVVLFLPVAEKEALAEPLANAGFIVHAYRYSDSGFCALLIEDHVSQGRVIRHEVQR